MKKKIIVDILMFILMLLEFQRNYLPSIIHEIIGVLLLILVIIHLVLNKNYFKNIFRKYNRSKIIMLAINIIFSTSFILSVLFGILSSQDLLKFLNIGSLSIIKMHKIFAYICLLSLGLHLGINCSSLLKKVIKMINNKAIIYLLTIIVICFGIYFFIDLDIFNHLIGKYGFSSNDSNIFFNLFKYLIIIISISLITNIIYKKIK